MGAKSTEANQAPGATGIGKRIQSGLKKTFEWVDSTSLGKYVDKTTRMNKGAKQ